jgi:hypothetical protein
LLFGDDFVPCESPRRALSAASQRWRALCDSASDEFSEPFSES